MAGAFDIGVSALIASQRQLSTTSHNIANANTVGYSRQHVELTQRPPQFLGAGFVGKGVDVSTIARSASEFLNSQVRNSASSEAKAVTFSDLAKQVDALVGDGSFGPALQRFFQTLQDANNEPASTPARQVFMTAAQSLTSQVRDIDHRFDALATSINNDIRHRVSEINTYATALANTNRDIVQAYGTGQGQTPNDLLDQRDQLLKEISKLANTSTLEMPDHSLNVFIGNGQLIVAGATTTPLTVTANPLDGGRLEVSSTTSGGSSIISESITSGSLAGVLQFRDEILNPSRNALGRLAVGMDFTLNAQHRAGLDLQGALGGDLFTIGTAVVNALPTNTSTISVALDPTNLPQLTDSDYELTHDGTNFVLRRLTDNVQQTLSGAGPFSVDGFTITVSGAPAAGDRFLVQPTRFVTRGFGVATTDPLKIALASPVKSSAALANISAAKISAPRVLDAQNPSLLAPTRWCSAARRRHFSSMVSGR